MATSTNNTFNFDAYNELMKGVNTGLKLFLAEQMLLDAQSVMVRFKSPLTKDITDIVDELGQLRQDNKKYLATRENRGRPEMEPDSHTTSVSSGKLSDISGPNATVVHTESKLATE